MESQSQPELDKVIRHLEDERKALLRTSFTLARKRDNIAKYLEIVTAAPAKNNAPKRRAQKMLRPIKEFSLDLFILCALATNQRLLGGVSWERDEIDTILQWWENKGAQKEQPLTSLLNIRRLFESTVQSIYFYYFAEVYPSDTLLSGTSRQSIDGTNDASSSQGVQIDDNQEQEQVLVKAAWLVNALKGKEDILLVLNRSNTYPTNSNIAIPADVEEMVLAQQTNELMIDEE